MVEIVVMSLLTIQASALIWYVRKVFFTGGSR